MKPTRVTTSPANFLPWIIVPRIKRPDLNSRSGGHSTTAVTKNEGMVNLYALRKKVQEEIGLPANFRTSIIGSSKSMQALRCAVAEGSVNGHLFISGPEGSGKSLVANDIHLNSGRGEKPFVVLDCAVIPDDLFEVALCGYEGERSAKGLLEAVNGGTIYLKNIEALELGNQITLAMILQNGAFRKAGGDSKVLAAKLLLGTSLNLKEAAGEFKVSSSLFEAIGEHKIEVPSLDSHGEDVVEIATHLLDLNHSFFQNRRATMISASAVQKLESHMWTGSVKELEKVIRRGILFSDNCVIRGEDVVFNDEEATVKVLESISDIARWDIPLLIFGNKEDEKRQVLETMVQKSNRASGPVLEVNCSEAGRALFDSLDSPLLTAYGGTAILHGVENLSRIDQQKLLTLLKTGEIGRKANASGTRIDARILVTSNVDLNKAVESGDLRKNLFEYLSVAFVVLPPFSEIPEKGRVVELPKKDGSSTPSATREPRKVVDDATKVDDGKPLMPKHPFAKRSLNEFVEYLSSDEEMDDYKIRFLFFKARAARWICESGKLQEREICNAHGKSSATLYRLVNKYGYSSTGDFVKELVRESITSVTSEEGSEISLPKNTVLLKHLQEIIDLTNLDAKFDKAADDRLRFLFIKLRMAKAIIDEGELSEVELAKKIGIDRKALRTLTSRFEYSPTAKLVSELAQENSEASSVASKEEVPKRVEPYHIDVNAV